MISLETQLSLLAQCGIKPCGGITTDDLLRESRREYYEKDPFRYLLVMLGNEIWVASEKQYRRASGVFWHFDSECIYGDGDYVKIARRMTELAGGDLPVSNLKDRVDYENKAAWLEFDLKGLTYRWDLYVNDDWLDSWVLGGFAALLEEQGTGKKYTYLDLGGQDGLIGCSAESEFAKLREVTGLNLQWLKELPWAA